MAVLGGGGLMSEVPLYNCRSLGVGIGVLDPACQLSQHVNLGIQGYLAHKKSSTPLGPP